MHSEETKRKISETKKLRFANGEVKPYWLNKTRDEEFKKIISRTMMGRVFSKETIEKQRVSKLMDKNPNWKGDDVSTPAVHMWLRQKYPAPPNCELCLIKTKDLDLANIIGHRYTRNIKDYRYLCSSCHHKFDNKIKIPVVAGGSICL